MKEIPMYSRYNAFMNEHLEINFTAESIINLCALADQVNILHIFER